MTESLADRYRFERELGQGGMATVYTLLAMGQVAEAVVLLERHVAAM